VYPGYGVFYVAEEKGFFEKHGVGVELVLVPDEDVLVSSFAGGTLDAIGTTADQTVVMAAAGIDTQQILVLDNGFGSDGILVTEDIRSMSDLKEKTVYLSRGNPSHFLFRWFAEKEGLKPEDIPLVNMTADQVGTAFLAKQINYGVSWEPWLSRAVKERNDGKLLHTSADDPGVILDTLAVRMNVLKERPQDVRAVVAALFDALEYTKAHPDETGEIMARGFKMEKAEFVPLLSTVQFHDREGNNRRFDRSTTNNIFAITSAAVDIFNKDKVLGRPVDPETLTNRSFIDEASPSP
jgi:NitT/TauT family transport system substrate-binding protein